jgi:hypothetical protein
MDEDPRTQQPEPKAAAEYPAVKEASPQKSPLEELEQILGDADEEDRFQRSDN